MIAPSCTLIDDAFLLAEIQRMSGGDVGPVKITVLKPSQ